MVVPNFFLMWQVQRNYALVAAAFRFYGQKEIPGIGSNPVILEIINRYVPTDDDGKVAWCSIFLMEVCRLCDIKTNASPAARSWLDVGREVKTPQFGDVAVFWRTSPSSWQGHVGLYLGERENDVLIISGNDADQVRVEYHEKRRLLGYRRI